MNKKQQKVNVSNSITNTQTINNNNRPIQRPIEEKEEEKDFKDFEEIPSKEINK